MDQQAAIPAITRGVSKTLVDGTLRITIEVEPQYAQQAFAMLHFPGDAIAIARIKNEKSS